MSNLPGNPHHDLAAKIQNRSELPSDLTSPSWPLSEISERLAALAFEQRTANLIAVAKSIDSLGVYALDPDLVHSAQDQLRERLGIEASK